MIVKILYATVTILLLYGHYLSTNLSFAYEEESSNESLWIDSQKDDTKTIKHGASIFGEIEQDKCSPSLIPSNKEKSMVDQHSNTTENFASEKTKGEFFNEAILTAVDTMTSEKFELRLKTNEQTTFLKLSLNLKTCWQQTDEASYNPESTALIEIIDPAHKRQIFSGWVIANHQPISRANYKTYSFHLKSCIPRNLEK